MPSSVAFQQNIAQSSHFQSEKGILPLHGFQLRPSHASENPHLLSTCPEAGPPGNTFQITLKQPYRKSKNRDGMSKPAASEQLGLGQSSKFPFTLEIQNVSDSKLIAAMNAG